MKISGGDDGDREISASHLSRESPHSGAELSFLGGDDGIRTHDPLLAGQVLSQLSYTPIIKWL